jgi:hypothetical protein
MVMTKEELQAKRNKLAGADALGITQPRITPEKKEKADQTAFDGSEMPKHDLPEVKFTNLEAVFAKAIQPIKPVAPPAMGMIYGPWGTLKTTTALKILLAITPTDKTILYIDSANGWSTLMNYPDMVQAALDGRLLRMAYENIEQLQVFFQQIIKIDKPPFNSIGAIVFDEYTSMHDSDLNWIVKSRAKQAKDDGGFKDSFTPALPDYNAARIRSNDLIYFAMRNNIHLIFIGHSKETKLKEQTPDMPEKAGKSLVKELHFVYYAYFDKQGQWKMQTVNGNRIAAKNRINGIGANTTPEEFIECYRNWGVVEKIKQVEIEAIPEEDLTSLLD